MSFKNIIWISRRRTTSDMSPESGKKRGACTSYVLLYNRVLQPVQNSVIRLFTFRDDSTAKAFLFWLPGNVECQIFFPGQGDRTRASAGALLGPTSAVQAMQRRSRQRIVQVWPLTCGEVITGTLSSVVTLYLNLKPACLGFRGPVADFWTKVAELFRYFSGTWSR